MSAEKAEPYQVLFAKELNRDFVGDPGTIVVAPSSDRWNDFGLQIRVNILVFPRADSDLRMEAWTLGFLGFTTSAAKIGDTRELESVFERASADLVPSAEAPPFFTMLPDMHTYRELVARLGPAETVIVLKALHDMVATEDRSTIDAWFRLAKESPVFLKGFLRSSESYFAWKNAGPVLQGEEFEEVGRLSETLRIQFQLSSRPNPHELEFRFALHEPLLPKRFAVIIGKNGVGKSQTLGAIARSALTGSSNLTDGDGQRPELNRLLAFYPTATSASVFPPLRRRRARIWYRRFSLGSSGLGRQRSTTSDLIVQLARSQERIAGVDRVRIFLDALKVLEGSEDLALRCRGTTRHFIPILDLLRGGEAEQLDRFAAIDTVAEPVRLSHERGYDLSSGELAFVRFAALASLYIENSSLLLFDEPETHLHPNFISQFVLLLNNLLAQTGSAAIISTHSAYFVRETFEDQVRILRSGPNREIEVVVPRLKTFGADVGAISYFVFGEDEPSRLAKQVENVIAETGNSWEQVFERYKDELSLDLLSEIRAQIEDRGLGAKRP